MKIKSLGLKIILPGMLLWLVGQFFILPYFVSATPSATFVSEWGSNDKSVNPIGVGSFAVNSTNDRVYMKQYGTILEFNPDGTFYSKLTSDLAGSPNGVDVSPSGVLYEFSYNRMKAIDTNGTVLFDTIYDQYMSITSLRYSTFNNRIYRSNNFTGTIDIFDANGTHVGSWNSGLVGGFIAISPVDGTVVVRRQQYVRTYTPSGTLIASWGSSGTGDGQIGTPAPYDTEGVAVRSDGLIYVADIGNHRIQVFQPNGTFVTKFGTSGTADGQFDYLSQLSFGSNNKLFVGDTHTSGDSRVQYFDSSNTFLGSFVPKHIAATGKFSYAEGIATDSSGNVYVADSDNNRIQVFDKDGAFLRTWDINYPTAVAISPLDGSVYVPDAFNYQIQKFTQAGTFVSKFGTFGSGIGQLNYAEGITVDADGNVYVADSSNDRIEVFDKDGAYLRTWGATGTNDGEFNYPSSIAYSPVNGNIYVADTQNRRVQEFNKDGAFITKWGTDGTGNGQFGYFEGITIDSHGNVLVADSRNSRIQVFDKDGNFITTWGSIGSGNMQFDYPTAVAVFDNNVYVMDDISKVKKYTIDIFALPPVFTTDEIAERTLASISGTSEPSATIAISLSGNTIGTATADSSGNWSAPLSSPITTVGQYTLSATQTDPSGNVSAAATKLFKVVSQLNTSGSTASGGGSSSSGFLHTETTPSKSTSTTSESQTPVIITQPSLQIPNTDNGMCEASFFTSKARFGSHGDEVSKIQQFLKDKGYYYGKITGFYGKWTELSVKNFQQAYFKEVLIPLNRIEPTGIWSYSTMGLANKLICLQGQ